MRLGPRPSRWPLSSLAGLLVIAGFAHLATILTLSHAAGGDAYRRVAALGRGDLLKTFAGAADADDVLPYRDPAMAMAFCLFDLTRGPIRVRLPVTGLDVAALTVHGADGRVRYGLSADAAVGDAIGVTISLRGEGVASAEMTAAGARLALDESQGFVAAQALADMPGETAEAAAEVRRLDCRPEKS